MCEANSWEEKCCDPPQIYNPNTKECDYAYHLTEHEYTNNEIPDGSSTAEPDESEREGKCNEAGPFMSLGVCDQCYCRCLAAGQLWIK